MNTNIYDPTLWLVNCDYVEEVLQIDPEIDCLDPKIGCNLIRLPPRFKNILKSRLPHARIRMWGRSAETVFNLTFIQALYATVKQAIGEIEIPPAIALNVPNHLIVWISEKYRQQIITARFNRFLDQIKEYIP